MRQLNARKRARMTSMEARTTRSSAARTTLTRRCCCCCSSSSSSSSSSSPSPPFPSCRCRRCCLSSLFFSALVVGSAFDFVLFCLPCLFASCSALLFYVLLRCLGPSGPPLAACPALFASPAWLCARCCCALALRARSARCRSRSVVRSFVRSCSVLLFEPCHSL